MSQHFLKPASYLWNDFTQTDTNCCCDIIRSILPSVTEWSNKILRVGRLINFRCEFLSFSLHHWKINKRYAKESHNLGLFGNIFASSRDKITFKYKAERFDNVSGYLSVCDWLLTSHFSLRQTQPGQREWQQWRLAPAQSRPRPAPAETQLQ